MTELEAIGTQKYLRSCGYPSRITSTGGEAEVRTWANGMTVIIAHAGMLPADYAMAWLEVSGPVRLAPSFGDRHKN